MKEGSPGVKRERRQEMCQLGTGKGKDFPKSKMGGPANLAKFREGAAQMSRSTPRKARVAGADPSSHQDPVFQAPGPGVEPHTSLGRQIFNQDADRAQTECQLCIGK